jgi:hypothetical protein
MAVPAVYAGVTVAVKVTAWLTLAGFNEDATVVVVVAVLTVCFRTGDVEVLKFVSEGVKVAVMLCVPCVESGTEQGGTLPPVNAELPVGGTVQPGRALPLS